MSKDKLTDYSATAASNTDIGGINIDEGMLPSGVNNALREQMSHLADFAAGTTGIDVLNLQDDDASHSIKIQAPASVTATTTFTLPDGDGSANQSLVTNGSGTLSFSTRLANVVEDTTPQLGGDLDTNGNDINFGDNDKAIFGAGSDLQIYHDGSNSFIKDTGTGNLTLQAEDFAVQSSDGSATHIFVDASSGYTALNFGGSTKLNTTNTGVNVTGTVTADGLTVDAAIPTLQLNDTDGTNQFGKMRQAGPNLLVTSRDNTSNGGFRIAGDNGTSETNRFNIASNGDISFYDSTGVSQGFFWDASAQSLGLGVTTNSHTLTVDGAIRVGAGDSGTSDMVLKAATNTAISVGGSTQGAIITTNGTSIGSVHVGIEVPSNDSNDGFYVATDSDNDGVVDTLAMKINAAGNVGIGTVSPATRLSIGDTTVNSENVLTLGKRVTSVQSNLPVIGHTSHNGTASDLGICATSSGGSVIFYTGNDAAGFGTGSNAERMRIDASGNVGIGIASPARQVHLHNSSGDNNLHITNSTTGATATDGFSIVSQSSTNDVLLNQRETANMRFFTGNTEAARIDSSQNLLVGTTSPVTVLRASTTEEGIAFQPNGQFAMTAAETTAGVALGYFNRRSSDGQILQFRKDGAEVGSIGVDADSTNLMIGNGVVGLRFVEGSNQIRPANIDTGGNRDDAIDLGYGSARFDDIYATNGTIQTSDANEKQDIEELSDAEQRVAVAAKGLLRKYRWKSSVEEKGNDARIHFGIIAQDLKAAFEAEGLDAGRYAMFINTEWTDEETGEQKSRMGIRYNQLLAFIIAAI